MVQSADIKLDETKMAKLKARFERFRRDNERPATARAHDAPTGHQDQPRSRARQR